MLKEIKELFGNIAYSNDNYIVNFEGVKRKSRTFKEFSDDLDRFIRQLIKLQDEFPIQKAAILGNLSYDWMVADFACIKYGIQVIAVPEFISDNQVDEILTENDVDILLLDLQFKERHIATNSNIPIYYINCHNQLHCDSFNNLPYNKDTEVKINIRKDYSIGFTSGTTQKIKKVNLCFYENEDKKPAKKTFFLKKAINLIKWKFSFWSKKNNNILIFLPFSHNQQRVFVFQALLMGINIVLSDPIKSILHLRTERSNILVSVPNFYDLLARHIENRLCQMKLFSKIAYKIYLFLKINTYSNNNLIKKFFDITVLKKVRIIAGGRADYFVSGSAPISRQTLDMLYKVGIRIFESYGLSELGLVSMNKIGEFKFGSVGIPTEEVKIAEDGEIMVKLNQNKHDYNRDILNVSCDNYVATGDLGYFDNDGFLFITGRKDDIIILKNGKKIHPYAIEEKLKAIPIIKDVIVYKNQNKLSAIIVTEACNNHAIKTEIEKYNTSLNNDNEVITRFISVNKNFSPEEGLLTSTFKHKRQAIIKEYDTHTPVFM